MAKLDQAAGTAALRVGNTIATPVRRGGEIANALRNVERQGLSSVKNIKEVQIQSLNALADNFLNFSKVAGKWYKRLAKGAVNLVSAVTRRPFMLAGAEVASTLNQGVWQPFKKLLYTPGKMFKGMRNATRIFSKKKGFDFATYDTHETKGDTWINQIRERRIGFFGKGGASEKKSEENQIEKIVEKKKEKPRKEAKPEAKPEPKMEVKKPEVIGEAKNKAPEQIGPEKGSLARMKKVEREKNDKEADEYLAERGYPPGEKFGTGRKDQPTSSTPKKPTSEVPKSIDDLQKKHKEEVAQKDKVALDKRQWKNLDDKFKIKLRKEFKEKLGDNPTKEKVIERGKKAKLGEKIDDIMPKVQKDFPEMAGYIQDEILDKAA